MRKLGHSAFSACVFPNEPELLERNVKHFFPSISNLKEIPMDAFDLNRCYGNELTDAVILGDNVVPRL